MSRPVPKAVPSSNLNCASKIPVSAPMPIPSATMDKIPVQAEVPTIIQDPLSKKKYQMGRFLGKGGFAKCYEMTDLDTQTVYAGKIVPKSLIAKPHQKEKMSTEIAIHRSLNHPHIVGFKSFFEDSDNVYVLLEICKRRSLMELHKRRKLLTDPEVRYYMRQIVDACVYLHRNKIIHRDLKLGNLFLNDDLEIKVGDFGLATRLDRDDERKMTLCGTPNYIAPEVLKKKGHSYEVDAWSLGCILYTLTVGTPPFETSSIKETYDRIKKNVYFIPLKVPKATSQLIVKLLQLEPSMRPSMEQIMNDEYFTTGYIPPNLPLSSLTMRPRFPDGPCTGARQVLVDLTGTDNLPVAAPTRLATLAKAPTGPAAEKSYAIQVINGTMCNVVEEADKVDDSEPEDCYLSELINQVNACLATRPHERIDCNEDEAEDPASTPVYWVSKWVDYANKYGLGYQLNDNTVGVFFNDSTQITCAEDGQMITYFSREGEENYFHRNNSPRELKKKITLLDYFLNYMNQHLLKAGANIQPPKGASMSRFPSLKHWTRNNSGISFLLSCGIFQTNYFVDHTKIIICAKMNAVSFIDEKRNFRTYKLSSIAQYGCGAALGTRLEYALSALERIRTELSRKKTAVASKP